MTIALYKLTYTIPYHTVLVCLLERHLVACLELHTFLNGSFQIETLTDVALKTVQHYTFELCLNNILYKQLSRVLQRESTNQ